MCDIICADFDVVAAFGATAVGAEAGAGAVAGGAAAAVSLIQ